MLRAIFFDFNGVLVDDEDVHFRTFQKVLKEEGIGVTEREYVEKYLARDDKGCFREALVQAGRASNPGAITELVRRKSVYYNEEIKRAFRAFPGAVQCVRKAAQKYPVGLVSGALRREIENALTALKLEKVFKVVVSSEDVKLSKPDPECYTTALKRLNADSGKSPRRFIQPGECAVFEDAIGGVDAAKAAGMKCIAVLNTYSRNDFPHADFHIESLAGLDLAQIEALF